MYFISETTKEVAIFTSRRRKIYSSNIRKPTIKVSIQSWNARQNKGIDYFYVPRIYFTEGARSSITRI